MAEGTEDKEIEVVERERFLESSKLGWEGTSDIGVARLDTTLMGIETLWHAQDAPNKVMLQEYV